MKSLSMIFFAVFFAAGARAETLRCRITDSDAARGAVRECATLSIADRPGVDGEHEIPKCSLSLSFFSSAFEKRSSVGLGILNPNEASEGSHLNEFATFEFESGNAPKRFALSLYPKSGDHAYRAECSAE